MESREFTSNIPPYDRVRSLTGSRFNAKIDQKTERILRGVEVMGPAEIRQRLKEVDKEWDIDRVLMVNFSIFVFAQLLAARKNKKWLWGPLIQTPFMFMHATLGWCPPSLWFRPMGIRTKKEIQAERGILIKLLDEYESSIEEDKASYEKHQH